MHDAYGPADLIELGRLALSSLQMARAVYIGEPKVDPVVRKSWEFYDGGSYAMNSYYKPTLMLETLRNYLGPETMEEILRVYTERWRFKHPRTEDFLAIANEVSGQDLSWFFDQALYTNAVLDYSVSSISSTEIEGEGFDFTLTTDQAMDDTSAEENEENDEEEETVDEDDAKQYRNEIKVRRRGEFKFPVQLEVVFEDGETIRESWDGQAAWKRFVYVESKRVSSASVDPDRSIPLDVNYNNNSRTREKQKLGVNKVSMRWLFLWQFLMDLLSI
jgi:hypothetical protein